MSRVLFNFWFSYQGIIQNTTCSIWFRIQRIIEKCPGYYSASGSLFRVLFKMRPAASGSGFSVLFKTVQGIIQRLVQYPGYYSKYDLQCLVQDSSYYLKRYRVLFSIWFIIQEFIQNTTCSVWFRIQRIIKKCPGYYSASGSVFRVLFKIRPAASGSEFSVLLNMSRVLFNFWFSNQGIIQNTTCSVWFKIQRIIEKCPRYYLASVSLFRIFLKIRPAASSSGFNVLLKNVQGIIHV